MYDFFMKLFKAFNSAQTPWQMSLALSLGMAMGLTPLSGVQSVVLIFLVFIINIHLGLFFVSTSFFAGVAYLFDPMFEQLGYGILINENLEGLFTSFYNSGLMRLTYFNNTLVLGSSVIAFSLLIPMYLILNKVVYVYRDKIAAKLSQYKIFKTLGIEVTDKKDKFIRLWGVALFIILGGIISVFLVLFMDPLAKSALKNTIEKMTSKNVDIKRVSVSFSDSKIDVDSLHVYDAKENIFKCKNIQLDIDFNQLLFQKYHIQNLNIIGMDFDTKATKKQTFSSSQNIKNSNKVIHTQQKEKNDDILASLPTPTELVSRVGLKSDKNLLDAQAKIKAIEKKYNDAIEKDFSTTQRDAIKKELKYLRKKIKDKDTSTLVEDIILIKKLRKTLKEKKHLALLLKKDFQQDKLMITNLSKTLKEDALNDYDRLSQNYRFDAKGGINVIGILFGEKSKTYLASFLKYYKIISPYLDDEEIEVVTPKRGEGRWIRFKDLSAKADLWVQKIEVSGIYETQSFKAIIQNLSSNQKMLQKPFKMQISGEGNLSKPFDLRLTKLESALYSFDAKIKTMDYKTLTGNAKVHYTNTNFSSKYLQKINEFDVDAKISKNITDPKLDVSSNLDEKLKVVFSNILHKKANKYKKELKNLIDKNTKESLASLTKNKDTLKYIEKVLGTNLGDINSKDKDLEVTQKKLKDNAKYKLKNKASKLLKSFKF